MKIKTMERGFVTVQELCELLSFALKEKYAIDKKISDVVFGYNESGDFGYTLTFKENVKE